MMVGTAPHRARGAQAAKSGRTVIAMVRGEWQIVMKNGEQMLSVTIVDSQGRRCYRAEPKGARVTISTASLRSGVYTVIVDTRSGRSVGRMVSAMR